MPPIKVPAGISQPTLPPNAFRLAAAADDVAAPALPVPVGVTVPDEVAVPEGVAAPVEVPLLA